MNKKFLIVALAVLVIFLGALIPNVVMALPSGASVSAVSNSTAGTGSAGGHAAYAGNISELTLTGYSTTQAWAGYFGNVSGTIQLADASSNALYNWSQATAAGEVYASLNSSISWSAIGCFNLTADNAQELADLESFFSIAADDVDRINATFDDATHSGFTLASQSFSANQCNSTDVYGPGGASTFEEILLLDDSNRTVYASLLSDDTAGFDSELHDFELIVPEDGHSGDTSATAYYFYVELDG